MSETRDGGRELLRHAVATLAYRASKALRDAPDTFAGFRVGDTTRTPAQIVAHMGDLMDWALSFATGNQIWADSEPMPWDREVARFFEALSRLEAHLASDLPLGRPAERIFQGPIADALTHVGQLTLMRRLAGRAVRGENYFKAHIEAGRVGMAQADPRMEFDRERETGRIIVPKA